MEQKNNTTEVVKEWILVVALLVMMVMAALPLFNVMGEWVRWAFAASAGVTLLVRLVQRHGDCNLRIKRLHRMNIIAAVMFCASAGVTFYHQGSSDWIALLMAGAVLQIYATAMIDRLTKQQEGSIHQ